MQWGTSGFSTCKLGRMMPTNMELYPDLRFSMRDAFLASSQKGFIKAVISEKVTETVKKALEQEEADQKLIKQENVASRDNGNESKSLRDPSQCSSHAAPPVAVISQQNSTVTILTIVHKENLRDKTVATFPNN
jgi:hypothetical protein